MRAALGLARRGLGTVWPNPAVGCVILSADGDVAGRGWTQPGGRPHAETEALARAGGRARGGTAYVTLEPCSHHGQTPPCAEALIEAGLRRVVIAVTDPDPRVDGGGAAMLEAAGIEVTAGVCEAAARAVNDGFISRVTAGRPRVSLKLATSLDGRIATASGESQWITGPAARATVHRLRAAHDVVLTGMGTVRADNPSLTVRLPGLPIRPPVRAVMTSGAMLPGGSALAQAEQDAPVWMVSAGEAAPAETARAETVIKVAADDSGRPDFAACIGALGEQGITRVMIEAGGGIVASALRSGVVDRIYWFQAAKVIGGDGLPVVGALGIEDLGSAPGFRVVSSRPVGDDLLTILERA